MSSFENAIGDAPRIASIEPGKVFRNGDISTAQLAIEADTRAQQVAFDSGDTLSNDNDFSIPEFVDDEGIGDDIDHKDMLVQDSATNPVTKDNLNTPAVDIPTAEVLELSSAANSTIIVEPVFEDSPQVPDASNESVDLSLPTTLSSENANLDLNSKENESGGSQLDNVLSNTADDLPTTGESFDDITPLKIPLNETAAQQAVHHIEYGKSLSRRGAAFAARQEFYSALRVIAESNDAATGTNRYSRSLSQAVLAMKEARDFVQTNTEAELLLDVAAVTETHRSRIINKSQAVSTSPAQAMQSYFVFAQKKLDQASGRNVVSAEALYCLGKLHTTVSKSKIVPDKIEIARGIAYHQSALMSDQSNFRSANELGVLLAQMGKLEHATELFKQSLITQPTPQAWRNLATTHRRLGQQELAQLAEREFSLLSQTEIASSNATIRWMPANAFSKKPPMDFLNKKQLASRPDTPPVKKQKTTTQKVQTKFKSFGERLKELF